MGLRQQPWRCHGDIMRRWSENDGKMMGRWWKMMEGWWKDDSRWKDDGRWWEGSGHWLSPQPWICPTNDHFRQSIPMTYFSPTFRLKPPIIHYSLTFISNHWNPTFPSFPSTCSLTISPSQQLPSRFLRLVGPQPVRQDHLDARHRQRAAGGLPQARRVEVCLRGARDRGRGGHTMGPRGPRGPWGHRLVGGWRF